jgi:hypothetical protein
MYGIKSILAISCTVLITYMVLSSELTISSTSEEQKCPYARGKAQSMVLKFVLITNIVLTLINSEK